jgi:hypothetical protein
MNEASANSWEAQMLSLARGPEQERRPALWSDEARKISHPVNEIDNRYGPPLSLKKAKQYMRNCGLPYNTICDCGCGRTIEYC